MPNRGAVHRQKRRSVRRRSTRSQRSTEDLLRLGFLAIVAVAVLVSLVWPDRQTILQHLVPLMPVFIGTK